MKKNTKILVPLSIITFIGLLLKANPKELGDELSKASVEFIALAIGVYLFTIFLKMLRWHLFLKSTGNHFPMKRTALFFLIGLSVNSVTPGGVSGEPVRVYFIKKEGRVPVGDGIATIFAERFMDITVLISFALFSLIFLFPLLAQHDFIQLMVPILLASALLVFVGYTITHPAFLDRITGWLLGIVRRFRGRPALEEKIEGLVMSFRRGIQELSGSKKHGAFFFLLSYFIWSCSTLRIYILLKAMDVEVSLFAVFLTSSITYIFGVILPGGAGNIAAITGVFSAVGVDFEVAAAVGVLEVATSLLFSVPAGLGAMAVTGVQIERSKVEVEAGEEGEVG